MSSLKSKVVCSVYSHIQLLKNWADEAQEDEFIKKQLSIISELSKDDADGNLVLQMKLGEKGLVSRELVARGSEFVEDHFIIAVYNKTGTYRSEKINQIPEDQGEKVGDQDKTPAN